MRPEWSSTLYFSIRASMSALLNLRLSVPRQVRNYTKIEVHYKLMSRLKIVSANSQNRFWYLRLPHRPNPFWVYRSQWRIPWFSLCPWRPVLTVSSQRPIQRSWMRLAFTEQKGGNCPQSKSLKRKQRLARVSQRRNGWLHSNMTIRSI